MPEHWLGQAGLPTIATRPFRLTQEALDEAADCSGIVALLGDGGYGKSYALDYWLEDAPVATAKLVPFAQTTARQFTADLLEAVRRDPEPPTGTQYTIAGQVIEELAGRPWLLAVDEGQWLSDGALKSARGIWLSPYTQAALVFAGGPEFEAMLLADTMLRRRLLTVVRFVPLSEEDVIEILPSYHSIYTDSDPALLLQINRDRCNGCFRLWANFTRLAARECEHRGLDTLDADTAAYVLEHYGL